MINFYRRTRKKMADDNKPLKYLKYAIGEIVLVVIGILIALQINNWNENRKNKIVEKGILTNIKIAFERDLKNVISSNLQLCNKRIETTNELIKASKNKQELIAKINGIQNLTRQPTFRIISFPLKILESKGLDIIKDDELKYLIVNIHTEEYSYIKTVFENEIFNQRDIYRPQLNQYFKKIMNGKEMEIQIINSSSMLKNQSFMNAIITMNQNNIYLKKLLEDLWAKVAHAIEQIENELES